MFESIIKTNIMNVAEINELINVYSMIRFTDGHREPGIIINKYDIEEATTEYFFIQHNYMNDYKNAHDRSDFKMCEHLSSPIDLEEIVSITPINLSDYKAILELHKEYKQPPNLSNG